MKVMKIWDSEDLASREYCVHYIEDELRIEGTVMRTNDGNPELICYQVQCGPDGSTRRVDIQYTQGEHRSVIVLEKIEYGKWLLDGEPVQGLGEAMDADISVTPATNTLPIRRMQLEVGESAELTAAWVRFPQLEVKPLRQCYTRLSMNTYQYLSCDSGYSAVLYVDGEGIILKYDGMWEEVG